MRAQCDRVSINAPRQIDSINQKCSGQFSRGSIYRKSGAPSISLEDKTNVLDRLDQIEKLRTYIDHWLIGDDGSYIGAFHMFAELSDFETMTEMHLRKLVERLLAD